MNPADLKSEVKKFWNAQSCDTQVAQSARFSRDYFEEIEAFRYFDQPFIHSFAQFPRYHGKRVLEVGFGAGTDFLQWVRAGALVSGVDLTQEAQQNLTARIAAYGLPQPEAIQVADAENLPFQADQFDLGYSFGVLHHTPNTERALAELIRVVKPGGEIKVMLYNRHSIWVWNTWIKYALLRGKPWKTLRWAMWHHMESLGTKGYTRNELARMLSAYPLHSILVRTEMTAADYLSASAMPPLNWLFRLCLKITANQEAWRPSDYVSRINDPNRRFIHHRPPSSTQRPEVNFTGNRLGFFHCLHARKDGDPSQLPDGR